jgi:hypothetical protein
MSKLTDGMIQNILAEISGPDENNRRALAKKRHDIYKDGGKEFLVEQIMREFGKDSLAEMRLTPINFLKKIVNALGAVYKRPPKRICQDPDDQALVDYYSHELDVNWLMQKANRYLVLAANTVIYARPWQNPDGTYSIRAQVTPSYLYSIVPKALDKCQIETVIFSAFVESGRITPQSAPPAATGVQGYSQERGYKTTEDYVASNERETALQSEQYIFWSDEEHVTTNESGSRFMMPGQGDEQFINPIGKMPIVNLARDRDNEPWATQGADLVDLTTALQLGWCDALTIAKTQGFAQMIMMSEEEPKKLTMGLNRALWLKIAPNSPTPSVSYVSPNSPLSEYTEMLDKLTKLMLTTNNMDPGSVGGDAKTTSYSSGFHALIAMSDNLEAIQSDQPTMAKAEDEFWDLIAKWHNWMLENGLLESEAAALGEFSEEFEVQVVYPDPRPLESEDERIARVKSLSDMGLITKRQALKTLHPEFTDEQIEALMQEIADEKSDNFAKAQTMITQQRPPMEVEEAEETDEEMPQGEELNG